MHITGHKYLWHVCRIRLRAFRFYICSFIEFYTKTLSYISLTSQKSCCDENNITINDVLTVLDLCHTHPASLRILLPVKLHALGCLDISILVLDELFDCSLIDSRIMSVYCYSLLLAVICLADLWPLRPWIVRCPAVWRLWHHLKLDYVYSALTNRCSNAVISCVTTADNKNIFTLTVYKLFICKS